MAQAQELAAPSLGKDLVGLEELSRAQIETILDTADRFKEISARPVKKVPALRNRTIVNAFFENSTRTRVSFEFAEKRTCTLSSPRTGTFMPTNVGSIGSSRPPRSTSTASWIRAGRPKSASSSSAARTVRPV